MGYPTSGKMLNLILDLKCPIGLKKYIQRLLNGPIYKSKNAYWYKDKKGTVQGPFCMTCFDTKAKLISLIHIFETSYRCDCCNNGKVIYVED